MNNQQSTTNIDFLQVTVHTREGIVYQGKATAVSGKNNKGVFDVLPMHANFVTTLFESIVVHTETGNPFNKPLERGLLWARSGNTVDVYVGIGTT